MELCFRIKNRPEQSASERIWVEAFLQELSSRPYSQRSGFGLHCIEGWVIKRVTILAGTCLVGAGLIRILWSSLLQKTGDGFAITGCLIAAEALVISLMLFEAQIRPASN